MFFNLDMSTLKIVGGLMTCFSGFVTANGGSFSRCSALQLTGTSRRSVQHVFPGFNLKRKKSAARLFSSTR